MARKAKVEQSQLARKAAAKDAAMAAAVELAVARKAKDTPHLRLRVEPSLLARLQKSADKNGRTLTGEIVDRLDASFKRDDIQGYVDATAQKIAERLLAAKSSPATSSQSAQSSVIPVMEYLRENLRKEHAGPPKIAEREIIEEELFELDLRVLSKHYPDTPVEEHVKYLREAAARRAAQRARTGDDQ